MTWEKAILAIFEKYNGIVTLKNLYQDVPLILNETVATDIPHNIRAYLRKLKQKKINQTNRIVSICLD
ncbi:MAG: hypothetical protein JRJ49_01095 [Deltaproteobacteria bacterium]|nr:hypothetical protein [Deltaproteobacteria bacterium]